MAFSFPLLYVEMAGGTALRAVAFGAIIIPDIRHDPIARRRVAAYQAFGRINARRQLSGTAQRSSAERRRQNER